MRSSSEAMSSTQEVRTGPSKCHPVIPPCQWPFANHFRCRDDTREVVGLFMCKGFMRPEENHQLAVPLEKARRLSPQVQRLLGYGISPPAVGFYRYKDPMQVLFDVNDEETVQL